MKSSSLRRVIVRRICLALSALAPLSCSKPISLSPFEDSRHHWYDVRDEQRLIDPMADQQRFADSDVGKIADNMLLYQNPNGGWPKNYDMQAILTEEQRSALSRDKDDRTSTIDNGATHSHVEYLAEAYARTGDVRYKEGCERGIDYLLAAQYSNGGWPQFFPDTSGYRRYITYNDGAMVGVMKVLRNIETQKSQYEFVDAARRTRCAGAFQRGLQCILNTQILQDGVPTGWCQQHDNRSLEPRWARSFEPAAVTSLESADVVEFLMSLSDPSPEVVRAVDAAIEWFRRSELSGIRLQTIAAPKTEYQYHTTSTDRVVVQDSTAPVIWSRYYELGTNTPLFCNRDGKVVYSLAEVDRERRTGYGWYAEEPAGTLKKYGSWKERLDRRRSSVVGLRRDSLVAAIEQDRRKTQEWLRTSPSSYLATIQRVDFEERSSLTVGRAPECDVQIDDPAFQPLHLRVTVVGDSFRVEAVDPAAFFGAGGDKRSAILPPSSITVGRFAIRLSHQRFPALIVFDTKSSRYAEYKGLKYFPIDLSYRFVLPLTPNEALDTVVIRSTRGNLRHALKVGWFEFKVGATPCRLEVSRLLEPGVGEDSYSVFFRDHTCGKESYGMGRYVDAEPLPDGRFVLDFNLAYNPACAFSSHYNCPIPPEGNSLPVEIRAGEMDGGYGVH